MDELGRCGAAELARAIRARRMSSRDAVQACLALTAAVNPALDAIVQPLPGPGIRRMSVQGPLARTVADPRLTLAAMAAPDHRDPWWVPAPLEGPPPARPIQASAGRRASCATATARRRRPTACALARRTALIRDWAALLEQHPIALGPVCAEPPFPWGPDTGSAESMARVRRAQGPQFRAPVLGLPAMSVPMGLADGLPTGVPLIAARFRQDPLLDAAEVPEARCPSSAPVDRRW